MKPKDSLNKDVIAEFTLNKSFNTYRGKIVKCDFNGLMEGAVMLNKKNHYYFYPLNALHMIKPLKNMPTNIIPKTSLPTNPKNINPKEALSRIIGRTLKVTYKNPKTSYLGRLLGFSRGVFSWTLLMEIYGETVILVNPDYISYYGTVWRLPRNNPPYKKPTLMNLTKTTQYLKKCLLDDVTLEIDYPRINIENRVFIYPHGIVSKDDYLCSIVKTHLKEHGLNIK
ncbi:hypothetical protein [Methanococcus voltae]|uniref:Uncharacterized protein n=2 Tax=Methanococcus voltae TaxID=2188 RepID=A0A8J7RHX1_METVO|nr:hypothetical protein [Methanococcus voltae]MBP2172800.1 hypothetical protein [Methanococcus voltae]MBP2201790.1 hypothetical protein [Methanococcus voltae]MCS3922614.1 hypothetical protein [Methanococcus voltae PS]